MITAFEVLQKLDAADASRHEVALIAYFIGQISRINPSLQMAEFDPLEFKRTNPAWYDRCKFLGLF